MKEDIVHKAKKIKLLVLDSDGVLTEEVLFTTARGEISGFLMLKTD